MPERSSACRSNQTARDSGCTCTRCCGGIWHCARDPGLPEKRSAGILTHVHKDAEILRATRRPRSILAGELTGCSRKFSRVLNIPSARRIALEEAEAVAREDTACCHAIGSHGAALLPDTVRCLRIVMRVHLPVLMGYGTGCDSLCSPGRVNR